MGVVVPCNGCDQKAFMGEEPLRGPSKKGNQAWICLWCDGMICVNCYMNHNGEEHPERYDPSLSKGSHKKTPVGKKQKRGTKKRQRSVGRERRNSRTWRVGRADEGGCLESS